MHTVAVLGLAIVATALTLPAFVQSLDWEGTPEDTANAPSDWAGILFLIAFFLGLASLVLGIRALRRQRRGSKQGRWLARCAVGLSVLGAIAWTYVALLSANASM
jgi:hypothetical protein